MNANLASGIIALRSWERENLPLDGSVVAVDVVLVLLAQGAAAALRVKDFHLLLRYSEDQIGPVLKLLVRDGWIVIDRDLDDRRVRRVHVSDKCRRIFGLYKKKLQLLHEFFQ